MKAEVKILRFDPKKGGEPIFQTYQVPYSQDDKILGTLIYIYKNFDPCLSFRFNCRGKHCGECSITINGKPGLSCAVPMSKTVILEPLRNLPIIKDLVINRTEIIKKIIEKIRNLWTNPIEDVSKKISIEFINKIICLENCIHCLCCMSVCPVYVEKPDKFIGPIGILILATSIKNNIDHSLYELVKPCIECGLCEDVCPRNIPIIKKGLYGIIGKNFKA